MYVIMDENAVVEFPACRNAARTGCETRGDGFHNDFLKHCPMPDGVAMLVATAQHQTAGRGQGTNKWESEWGETFSSRCSCNP